MAAGGEADERWSTIGDTVTTSSSLMILMQKGPTIGDTVKSHLLP